MNIGNQIQALRKQKNLTQEALATEMGVSIAAVSKWETGNSMPDIIMLCALADFFQVTTDVLLDRNNKTQDIVVCDDAVFMRETLRNILVNEGYQNVRLAENGKQLLDLISEKTPYAVFLDIVLPDISGLELLQTIKRQNSGIKVILVTADNSSGTVSKSIEYGADGFITKPFGEDHIKIIIDKHIC